jgi:hypothetical protein
MLMKAQGSLGHKRHCHCNPSPDKTLQAHHTNQSPEATAANTYNTKHPRQPQSQPRRKE